MSSQGEVVVQDDCSRLGLRVVHVMRMGAPVEVEEYLGMVPGVAMETAHWIRREERELGVHHLYLMWKAREGVRILTPWPPLPFSAKSGEGVKWVEAVVWWVAPGETLREAAKAAAGEFWVKWGRKADTVWVKKLATEGTEDTEVREKRVEGYEGELVVREAEWMMPRFVMLTKEAYGYEDQAVDVHGE